MRSSCAGRAGGRIADQTHGKARTLGIALAAWAVASLIYMIPALPAACAALAIFGIAVPLNTVVVSAATQRHSPPHLQGRTFAASFMATDLAQTLSITIGAAIPVLTRPAERLGRSAE